MGARDFRHDVEAIFFIDRQIDPTLRVSKSRLFY
jgi:hypothetical protein